MPQAQVFDSMFADKPADNKNDTAVKNSHSSNLFADAYDKISTQVQEHPKETAMLVGGAVVGAVAIAAARGQIMRTAAKEVLLIEDTPFMGQAYKTALEANGEKVTWFTGVSKGAPFTGTTLEGKSMIVDPRKFKIALVDGELRGSVLQGEHVVQALDRSGLRSIGTSTVESQNIAMLNNGAKLAAPKGTILSALIEDNLNLQRAVSAPGPVQRGLNLLTESMKGDAGKAMRAKGDALLRHCMEDTGI